MTKRFALYRMTVLAAGAVLGSCAGGTAATTAPSGAAVARSETAAAGAPNDRHTVSPIKHVIVIIGENRSFDHVFATYVPSRPGETVNNLLSEGIVALDADGNAVPGPGFAKARQLAAADFGPADSFLLSPPKQAFAHDRLPAPLAGGPQLSYIPNQCTDGTPITRCQASLALAVQTENGLDPAYYPYLLSGGTGQSGHPPDQRIAGVKALLPGPFQLTNGGSFRYDAYAASPVHRFYQMWQQLDCSAARATPENPSGCDGRLFSWVEVAVGAGSNGAVPPPDFSTEYAPNATTTGEGSTALGFYNVQKGDAPYFTRLAQQYGMSDNFHQSVNGGTGTNHIMFGHADMLWFSDASGNPAAPPDGAEVFAGTPDRGTVSEIENPNPRPGSNNWYTQDGYGNSHNAGHPPPYTDQPVSGGGSYSNCADTSQPGVAAIVNYLRSLPRPVDPRCEAGHYYLLNNYNPGWFGNGRNAYADQDPANTPFTIPPSSVPGIGDSLNAAGISWKYYGDQWHNYIDDPYQLHWGAAGAAADEYCNICNPFQYDTSIMSHPQQVAAHIQDTLNLYTDIRSGTLPAVSIVKPSGYVDGHPASSKLDLFEGFVKKIVDQVQGSPYARDTAIFITFDEGGGYYDSGYVQPVDFFGDGTRIPLIVVSPYVKPGHVSHEYSDHVSIIKFIERNWNLAPITRRSRDNFPNPVTAPGNPYMPVNSPALGDLFEMFDFPRDGSAG